MKKNTMMRVASVLLVAVLLSTSVISGTFAKYVTSDSAKDTARVAKFGVVATVAGDLYGETYMAVANQNAITSYGVNTPTVSAAATGTKVVAPGTNGGTMSFSVAGTPEVSTKVHFTPAENEAAKDYAVSDITLNAGDYGVMVLYTGTKTIQNQGNYYTLSNNVFTKISGDSLATGDWYELKDVANVASAYQPVVYTWNIGSGDATGTAAAAYTAISGLFNDKPFNPNEANTLSATLTWSWAFGTAWDDDISGENYTASDKADTILGDMIAKSVDSTLGYTVVVKNGDNYNAVAYAEVGLTTNSANKAVIAYNATASAAPATAAADGVLANLTAAFNARIIVEQVD